MMQEKAWVVALFCAVAACQSQPIAAPQGQAPVPLATASAAGGDSTALHVLQPPADPTEVTVTFRYPRGEVSPTAMGAIGFSEPMVALGEVDSIAQVPEVTVNPPVPLRWQWTGTSTLAFFPSQPMPGSTTFTVAVRPGLKALSGRPLNRSESWQFSTPRPHMIASLPPNGAKEIERKPTLALVFDQPLVASSLPGQITVALPGGKAAPPKIELLSGKPLQTFLLSVRNGPQAARFAVTDSLEKRVVLMSFARPLPGLAAVTVQLGTGITGEQGPDLPKVAGRLTFSTLGPLRLLHGGCRGTCVPGDYEPVHFEFNNELAYFEDAELSALFQVTPPVPELRIFGWGKSLNMNGQFAPGQSYSVVVSGELRDAHGQKLGKDQKFQLNFGHMQSQLQWAIDGSTFEHGARPWRAAVDVRNLKTIEVQYHVVTDHFTEWSQFARHDGAGDAAKVNLPLDAKTLSLGGTKVQDVRENKIIDLDKLLGNKPGLVAMRVGSPQVVGRDKKPEVVEELFQVTDLHVLAKRSEDATLVWVTSYSSGKPVAGAKVRVLSQGEKLVWQGETDAQGLARGPATPTPHNDSETMGTPQQPTAPVVVVEKEGDRALMALSWDMRAAETTASLNDGDSDQDRVRGWQFLDKHVYRHGETVHVAGIARVIAANGLELPAQGTEVTVELTDPRGIEVATARGKLTAQGMFHVPIVVPSTAAYGQWTVHSRVLGRTLTDDFLVMLYKTPIFNLTTQVAVPIVNQGDPQELSVDANFLTGGPMAGAAATYNVSSERMFAEPPGWSGYTFTPPWDNETPGNSVDLQQSGKGVLDAKGHWHQPVPTNVKNTGSLQVTVEATVADPSGRTLSRSAGFVLHPAAVELGLMLDRSVAESGKPLTIKAIAVEHDGKAAAGLPIEVTAFHQEWKQVRIQSIGGQVEWQTKRVESPAGACKLNSAAAPVACTLTLVKPGSYTLRGTVTDAKQRHAFSQENVAVVGPGKASFAAAGEDEKPLVEADKALYSVGETAKIAVRNPVPGATALVTEERAGVTHMRLVTFKNASDVIEIPIEARHQPDVVVGVSLFVGRRSPIAIGKKDTGAPQMLLGYVKLNVKHDDRKLGVQVHTDTDTYRPGAKVAVTVDVKDARGQGKAAEVTLWAVDEGVLSLTNMVTPDPYPAMYADIGMGVENFATIATLVRGRVSEDKGQDGGGGGAGLRSNFRDVAFYSASMQTGPDGVARGTFILPDNVTSFRTMAVAASGQEFGSGEGKFTVKRPLMLLPSLPHAVQLGDRFQLSATLRNLTDKPLAVQASLQTGAELKVLEAAQKTVQIASNTSQELTFSVEALAEGNPLVTMTAQGEGDQDAVAVHLPVLDPRPTLSAATYGSANGNLREGLQKAVSARTDVGGVTVTLAATGLVGLQRGLQWLIAYPYGCTEQISSRLLALLHAEALMHDFGLKTDALRDAPAMADSAISKLLGNRLESGGFSLWPAGENADNEATAWALEVLTQARAKGHAVDADVLRKAAAYLRTTLDGKKVAQYASPRQFDAARALYLHAMATAGHPDSGYVQQVWKNQENLPADARLLLAGAAAMSGQKDMARAALDDITRQIRIDADSAHVQQPAELELEGLWSSEVRTNALLLELMLQLQPDHPLAGRVAHWLVAQRRDDRWGNTQENAQALQALSGYFQSVEKAVPNLQATVQLAGKVIGHKSWNQRSLEVAELFVPQAQLPNTLANLDIERQGTGVLHYGIRYAYAPKLAAAHAINAGLQVRRVVFDLTGKQDPKTLARGEQVLVVVTVLADSSHAYVAVTDRPPAGLEAQNFELATSSPAMAKRFEALRKSLGLAGHVDDEDWSDGAAFREIAMGEVRFFVDQLTPGVHTFAYVARAANRGAFRGLGARAEAMYNPELFGTSEPVELTVQ